MNEKLKDVKWEVLTQNIENHRYIFDDMRIVLDISMYGVKDCHP